MTRVRLPEGVGTRRLWNDVIAQYYDYAERPEWRETDAGRVARMKRECAEALVAELPDAERVDSAESSEDDDDSDEETPAEAGTRRTHVEFAREAGDAQTPGQAAERIQPDEGGDGDE